MNYINQILKNQHITKKEQEICLSEQISCFYQLSPLVNRHLEDAFLHVALTEHGSVTILGEEDCELTLANGVEALRNIGKELDILSLIEVSLGCEAILLLAPAKYLIRSAQQQLDVDILTVQLQTSLLNLAQVQLLNADEDIIAINIVTTAWERRNVIVVDEIEYGLKTRMKRRVLRFVFQ